jgi:hypothetical protein
MENDDNIPVAKAIAVTPVAPAAEPANAPTADVEVRRAEPVTQPSTQPATPLELPAITLPPPPEIDLSN